MSFTQFVLDLIAEDEAIAIAVSDALEVDRTWHESGTGVRARQPKIGGLLLSDSSEAFDELDKLEPDPTRFPDHSAVRPGTVEFPKHIARYDPRRVLAECNLKRELLRVHGAEGECSYHQPDGSTVGIEIDCWLLPLIARAYGQEWDTTTA